MRDVKAPTRHGAAAVLRVLALVASRPGHARERWYSRVYDEIQKGLSERPGVFGGESRPTEAVHGALLSTAELLDARGATLTEGQLDALFKGAWACRDHREKAVRRAVLDVVPRMAAHCSRSVVEGVEGRGSRPNLFEERYLQSSVELMVTALRSAQYVDMHDIIFHAVGEIALHTKEHRPRPRPVEQRPRRGRAAAAAAAARRPPRPRPASRCHSSTGRRCRGSSSAAGAAGGAAAPAVQQLPALLGQLKESRRQGPSSAAKGRDLPPHAALAAEAGRVRRELAVAWGRCSPPPWARSSRASSLAASRAASCPRCRPSRSTSSEAPSCSATSSTPPRPPRADALRRVGAPLAGRAVNAIALASVDLGAAGGGVGAAADASAAMAIAVHTLPLRRPRLAGGARVLCRVLELASRYVDSPRSRCAAATRAQARRRAADTEASTRRPTRQPEVLEHAAGGGSSGGGGGGAAARHARRTKPWGCALPRAPTRAGGSAYRRWCCGRRRRRRGVGRRGRARVAHRIELHG